MEDRNNFTIVITGIMKRSNIVLCHRLFPHAGIKKSVPFCIKRTLALIAYSPALILLVRRSLASPITLPCST